MQPIELKSTQFVVFDLETTGLYADAGDEMIEIGGVLVDGTRIRDETYQSLINPEKPIPQAASAINGIYDEDVAKAQTAKYVIPRFLEFASNRIWVAQNAKFDLSFMMRKMHALQISFKPTLVIDTIGISKILFQYETSHSLDRMMARLGIVKSGDRHRSLDDSRYTAKVLVEFIQMLEQQGLTKLTDIESAFVNIGAIMKQEKPKTANLFGR